MEHRPEPQIVTWDPSFCRGFGSFPPLACGGARIRCTQVCFLLLSIALAVNFTLYENTKLECARACGYQAVLGPRISGISARAADTKARCAICLVMLSGSDHFEQLTNSFCQCVTNSILNPLLLPGTTEAFKSKPQTNSLALTSV